MADSHFAPGGLWPGKPDASRSLVQLRGKGVDTTGGSVSGSGAQTSHLCPLSHLSACLRWVWSSRGVVLQPFPRGTGRVQHLCVEGGGPV